MSNTSSFSGTKKIPVSCNKDCGGGCPLVAHVKDGRIEKITNSRHGAPYMTGCSNGFQAHRVAYASDRLTAPLAQVGSRGAGEYKIMPWDEALDLVAHRLNDIKSKFGSETILHLGGSGACHGALHHTGKLSRRFLRLFGRSSERVGSYSLAATAYAVPFVLGNSPAGLDAGTLEFSRLIILWGANIVDNRFGNEMERRILEQKKKGIPVIVVDPRRSRTVTGLGTQWIPVRPGTDTALMSAMLYVMIEEGLIDEQFVRKYSIGFGELKDYISGAVDGFPKTPAWAENICGTPREIIHSFARLYGSTKPTALIPGLSIQRTIGGEEAARMAVALQIVTANIGVRGGSTGANTWGALQKVRCGSLPVPYEPNTVEIPGYRWPDAILEGEAGGFPVDVRAIYNVGGNFLSQGSDITKNISAFKKVDFSVCHELFMTPTARYCDIILPVSTWLEREDIIFPDNNYLLYSHKAIAPLPGVRDDYDIFSELADRLGFLREFTEGRTKEEWLDHFLANSEIDDVAAFKHAGIYAGKEQGRTGMSEFIADPENNRLTTPSGLMEISSKRYARTGFPAYPHCRFLPGDDEYPLRMITPHARYRINSSYSNVPWFRDQEKQEVWIHPDDAEKRGIRHGQMVCIFNNKGRINILAKVTSDIMPGVVCLSQGVWPEFSEDGTETAGSPNVLTSTDPTLPSEGSRTHSVLVQVSAVAL